MSTSANAYRVTASLNGQSIGTWDTFSGGGVTSDPKKRHPGGSRNPVVGTSRSNREDVTISRVQSNSPANETAHREWERLAGRGELAVTKTPLDEDGNPWGTPRTYIGRLKDVTPADYDSESEDDITVELTMVVWQAS